MGALKLAVRAGIAAGCLALAACSEEEPGPAQPDVVQPVEPAKVDTSQAVTIDPTRFGQGLEGPGIEMGEGMGFVLQKGSERGLTVEPHISGRGNVVVDGDEVFSRGELENRGMDQKLRVDRFLSTDDVVIVKVNVGIDSKASLLGEAGQEADITLPPLLVDTNGTKYEAVGFVYRDDEMARIRYTVGQPLKAMSEAPGLSRSRPSQQLMLVFRVNAGVKVTQFRIGNKVIAQYKPPLDTERARR